MPEITVQVRRDRTAEGQEAWQYCELPDDEDTGIIAEGLRAQFDLPDRANNDRLAYYFEHLEGRDGKPNVAIKAPETLAGAGVKKGDHLTLAVEPSAGR